MQKASQASPGSPTRASGLGTLAVLVLLGVGVTAGYMQWKAPAVRAIVDGRRSEVAAAPSTPEGRLVHWLKYSDALIHGHLQEMRFSAAMPWLVTFAVAAQDSEAKGDARAGSAPPGSRAFEIYGIDLSDMPRELGRIDGLSIVVKLPRARRLGRGELTGDNASFVPIVPDSPNLPDADRRARELAAWSLQSLSQALERDIPGAHLSIEIGPEATWSEILEARSKAIADQAAAPSDRH